MACLLWEINIYMNIPMKKFNILSNFVYSGRQVDLYYNDNEISFI